MALTVVVVESGGLPVTEAENGVGVPIQIADNGFGIAVTYVDALGLGVVTSGGGAAAIQLSGSTVAEDASVGDLVGTLSVSNGSGSYTFTLTDDAGGLFAIDGDDLEVADALDYETATSHSVTVEADNGVDPPISRQFTINVTDVEEDGPTAPVLVWVSDENDLTPEGTVTIDNTIGAGDKVYSEIKLSSEDWGDADVTEHEITVPEDVADLIDLGLSDRPAGATDWRVRVWRASDELYSDYSNIESKTLIAADLTREFAGLGAYINSAGLRQFASTDAYVVETV